MWEWARSRGRNGRNHCELLGRVWGPPPIMKDLGGGSAELSHPNLPAQHLCWLSDPCLSHERRTCLSDGPCLWDISLIRKKGLLLVHSQRNFDGKKVVCLFTVCVRFLKLNEMHSDESNVCFWLKVMEVVNKIEGLCKVYKILKKERIKHKKVNSDTMLLFSELIDERLGC